MRIRLASLPLLALTVIQIACSHTYAFNANPQVSAIRNQKLSGRTLSIDLSGVPESFSASAQGHSFTVVGIREHTSSVVRSLFADDQWVDDPSNADFTFRPRLELAIDGMVGGARCSATSRWDLVRRDKVASSGEASFTSSFPVIANVGRNCEIASLKSNAQALDKALAGL